MLTLIGTLRVVVDAFCDVIPIYRTCRIYRRNQGGCLRHLVVEPALANLTMGSAADVIGNPAHVLEIKGEKFHDPICRIASSISSV